MGAHIGWGNNSKIDTSKTDFEKRTSWEVADASKHFHRLFQTPLLKYVGRVVKVLSPPQATGLVFEFGPGMHDEFVQLIDKSAFPPKSWADGIRRDFVPQIVIPDEPGRQHRDAWWRRLAAGQAIGASFREEGTDTSVHIAFNKTLCDVHVDKSGFVVNDGSRVYWNLNNLIRHFTLDIAGDKAPWLLVSFTITQNKLPLVDATLGPWLAVDLPSRENDGKAGVKIGLVLTGRF